ncbi:MAG: lytic transglycosylase domain-containing protein [Ignavibacteriales bacterium]
MIVDLRSIVRGALYALALGLVFLTLVAAGRALYPIGFSDIVDRCSSDFVLDRSLVYAVIRVESGFNPQATSAVGASGLMQIMPGTGSWVASQLGIPFSDGDLRDPEMNIRLGSFYLRHLIDRFDGDPTTALAAYNAGLRNVQDWLETAGKRRLEPGDIPFAETRQFVQRVARDRRVYRFLYPRYLRD